MNCTPGSLEHLAERARDAASRLATPEAARAAVLAPGASRDSLRVVMFLDLARITASRLEGVWAALDGSGDDLREALNDCAGSGTLSLADVIQCPNCMRVVRLPRPVRMTGRSAMPPVPPHGCASCSGDWDCPRDLNWQQAGMRGPCTEEHGEANGPLVIGFLPAGHPV